MSPKDVMQKLGYELIYADTDSVFIEKPNGIHRSV
jgi:DNA polymerase elongation subunit (family B)